LKFHSTFIDNNDILLSNDITLIDIIKSMSQVSTNIFDSNKRIMVCNKIIVLKIVFGKYK